MRGSNKIVKTFLNEMWNAKANDIENLHKIFNPHLIAHSPLGRKIGIEALKEVNLHWSHAFPDMELSSINLNSYHNTIMAEWRSHGTHEDVFNGRNATGKIVDYIGVTTFHFEGKQVSRYQCSIDLVNIYEQLGYHLQKQQYENQNVIGQDFNLLISTLKQTLPSTSNLSCRELQCISFFLHGWSSKNIASHFGGSYRTVQTHLSHAMDKLDCHSRHHLLELFRGLNLSEILEDFYRLNLQNYTRH